MFQPRYPAYQSADTMYPGDSDNSLAFPSSSGILSESGAYQDVFQVNKTTSQPDLQQTTHYHVPNKTEHPEHDKTDH